MVAHRSCSRNANCASIRPTIRSTADCTEPALARAEAACHAACWSVSEASEAIGSPAKNCAQRYGRDRRLGSQRPAGLFVPACWGTARPPSPSNNADKRRAPQISTSLIPPTDTCSAHQVLAAVLHEYSSILPAYAPRLLATSTGTEAEAEARGHPVNFMRWLDRFQAPRSYHPLARPLARHPVVITCSQPSRTLSNLIAISRARASAPTCALTPS